jgi:SAM-dependent methyltransferase
MTSAPRILPTLVKWSLYQINSVALWTTKHRKVAVGDGIIKVNFGSSLFVTEGWINVDSSPHLLFARWPKPILRFLHSLSDARNWCEDGNLYITRLRNNRFVHHDLENGLPFPNESVDYVYSSHVLEHFYSDTAESVLRDAYRVLRKGARIRICVPDLQHALELYAKCQKEEALAYFFQPKDRPLFSRHHYMYDFQLLASLLQRVGFHSVEKCNYRQGLVPDLDELDNRPEETLYVEAVK